MRRTRYRDTDSSKQTNTDASEGSEVTTTARAKRQAKTAATEAEDEAARADRAFQDKLRDVMRQVPPEYKDKSFSHIAVVARSLKKQRPQDDLNELNKAYDELSAAVSDIVDVNYKGFNKSIRNFSDILQNLESSRTKIDGLDTDLTQCEDLLTSRADELAQLYATYLQHTEFLKILCQVEEVKSVPEILNRAIKEKHFLFAVEQILKYEEMLQKEELKNIGALVDIRTAIDDHKKSLPEVLVDELNHFCFHYHPEVTDTSSKKSATFAPTDSTADAVPRPAANGATSKKDIENNIRTRVRKMTLRAPPASFGSAPAQDDNTAVDDHQQQQPPVRPTEDKQQSAPAQVVDDPSVNIAETDKPYYVKTIIEALDSLDQLSESQSKLIQSMRYELRALIDDHLSSFVQQFRNTDLAWNLHNLNYNTTDAKFQAGPQSTTPQTPGGNAAQNATPTSQSATLNSGPTPFYRAILQGQTLVDLTQSLFKKLEDVMLNFKFVIDSIGKKLEQRSKEQAQRRRHQSSASIDWSNGGDIYNIRITRDVLARLRHTVRMKLEDLRMQKQPNIAYISALEDLLFNFIEKNSQLSQGTSSNMANLQGMKVNSLPDMFWGMLKTQITVQQEDPNKKRFQDLKQDFAALLLVALSSSNQPRFLTMEHVWKTIQDELKHLLRDVLGAHAMDDALDNDALLQQATAGANLRFRFSSNIDFADQSGQTADKSQFYSAAVHSLLDFFSFTPYNLIWLYRPIVQFIEQTKKSISSMLGDAPAASQTTTSSGSDPTSTPPPQSQVDVISSIITDFMNDAVKDSLLIRVRADYRQLLSECLTSPEAFHPLDSTASGFSRFGKTVHSREGAQENTGLRTLLNSAVQLACWLAELFQLSNSITPYRKEFFAIMEQLLQLYIEECKNQFRAAIANKFVKELLDRPDIQPVLESDPHWKKIYMNMLRRQFCMMESFINDEDYKFLQSNGFGTMESNLVIDFQDSPAAIQFRDILRDLIDDEMLGMDNLFRHQILDDVYNITLLSTMSESLEWLQDQIVAIAHWKELNPLGKLNFAKNVLSALRSGAGMGLTATAGGGSGNSLLSLQTAVGQTAPTSTGSDLLNLTSLSSNSNPLFMLLMLDEGKPDSSSAVQSPRMGSAAPKPGVAQDAEALSRSTKISFAGAETLEEYYRKLGLLSNQCLFALKLDMRIRCFFYLNPLKSGVSFWCDEEATEPDGFIKQFTQELTRIDKTLSRYMPIEKSSFVFAGVAALISYILISSLAYMKERRFNELGVRKMKRNIYAIQQNITNIVRSKQVQSHFNKAILYYDLLLLTEKELLAHVQEAFETEEGPQFDLSEYKTLLQTESPKHERGILQPCLITLEEIFRAASGRG